MCGLRTAGLVLAAGCHFPRPDLLETAYPIPWRSAEREIGIQYDLRRSLILRRARKLARSGAFTTHEPLLSTLQEGGYPDARDLIPADLLSQLDLLCEMATTPPAVGRPRVRRQDQPAVRGVFKENAELSPESSS